MKKYSKFKITLLASLAVLLLAAGIGYTNRGTLAAWGYDTFLSKQFLPTDHQIKSYTLLGEGKRMGPHDLWYFVADENDLQAVRQTIDMWMNPNSAPGNLTLPSEAKSTIKPQYPA